MRLARVQTRVVRMEIAWELEEWSLFDEDTNAVEAEILEADHLSLATMRFFLALRGEAQNAAPAHAPKGNSNAFRPLDFVSDVSAADRSGRPTSPLEGLWIERVQGALTQAQKPRDRDDQSKNWRDWAEKRRIAPPLAGGRT